MSERDDYVAGRLLDRDDEREHRLAWEAQQAEDLGLDRRHVTRDEMIEHLAAERRAVEGAAAEAHERHLAQHPASARARYPMGSES